MTLNQQPFLRRLGLGDDARVLIIHADDAGMCLSANLATAAALDRGIVTSASVMVPCPWFLHFAEWARANPEADIGIHLTLTSEWTHYRWRPISSLDRVPSLVDQDGYFWQTTRQVFDHAKLSEMEIEARAQIEMALRCGIKPTHLDVHMGVFSVKGGHDLFLRLSYEYGILPRLYLRDQQDLVGNETGIPAASPLHIKAKHPTLENLREALVERIQSLQPGIWQITLHLNRDEDEIRHITPDWQNRFHEFLLFTAPETKQMLDDAGIILTGYRTFNDLWKDSESLSGVVEV